MKTFSDSIYFNFEELYNHAPCGYITTSADGTIIQANDTFLNLVGTQRELVEFTLKLTDFFSVGSKMYYETIYTPLLGMQKTVKEINFELVNNGSRIPVLINTSQIQDSEGRILNHSTIFDITHRKSYERDLVETRSKAEKLASDLIDLNKKIEIQSQQLSIQNEKLKALNATKDKFFGIVAHDLKSPLTSLRSFISLMNDHYLTLTREEIIKMIYDLGSAVDSTLKLTDNLIIWSQSQMREVSLRPVKIDLTAKCISAFGIYEKVASAKNITMSINCEVGLVAIFDEDQFDFVVRNLINNAIKFTPTLGHISISAFKRGEQIIISVKDTGIGMSADMQSHIFSLGFHKSVGTGGEIGSGLGLMLCYQFLQANDARIQVDSQLGSGTTISLIIKST